jgi:hypothetical protein
VTEAGYHGERHPRGIAVYGSVPLSHLLNVVATAVSQGYTIADSAIAARLGATLAVTTAEGSRAWREELGL